MELSRHQRRMLLVQALFLWENGMLKNKRKEQLIHSAEDVIGYVWENLSPTPYPKDFTDFDRERFFGMIQHMNDLNRSLIRLAPEWPLERIAPGDRAVLYLGLYELLYTDVPPPVVINEGVELAKAFGGERSSKFINGVLGNAMKTLKK
ncbi:MAG: transcription antitermination factor NusB [bacterium]|nr:transcription antitermination factor NusB [bacterium]